MRAPAIVLTNQSGVACGRYAWTEFEEVQEATMAAQPQVANARMDAVLAYGYHEDGVGQFSVRDRPWRKSYRGCWSRRLNVWACF